MKRLFVFAVVPVLLSAMAWCQAGDPELAEASAFGGFVSGIGTHGFVGAGAGMAIGKYFQGVGEVSFAPIGSNTIRDHPATQTVQQSRVYDFNFSLHVQFPIGKKLAPYAIAGPSVIWNSFQSTTVGPGGDVKALAVNETNFGFHTGGGVRYYLPHDWGIRPEVRVVISAKTYVVTSVGLFYTFPKE